MRRARLTSIGRPHHVTQRGNRRANVFLEAEDYHLYLEIIKEYSLRHRLGIAAYCLMTNHVHLIVVPETEDAMSKALRDAHSTYAYFFNRRNGFSGHLWQGRFYSCVLDEAHLLHAARYVERNPLRAQRGMAERAEDYPWSSAQPHVSKCEDRYINVELPALDEIKDWFAWLEMEESPSVVQTIRLATAKGIACGSDAFVEQIERESGRVLRPQKRGRKARPTESNELETQQTGSLLPAGW